MGVQIAAIHPNVAKSQFRSTGSNVAVPIQLGALIQQVDDVQVTSEPELFRLLQNRTSQCSVRMFDPISRLSTDGTLTLRNVVCPAPRTYVPLPNGKLFFLHIVDTDDPTIGESVMRNAGAWEEMVIGEVRQERLGMCRTLQSQECSADQLLRTVAAMNLTPADTLFVYVQGHGAYDLNLSEVEQDPSSGHFLHFKDYDVRRRDLLHYLVAKEARLTILLTDCCNVHCQVPFIPRTISKTFGRPMGWTPLEELMFCYAGLVDITSASRGEMSWCSPNKGGWFTTEAIELFRSNPLATTRTWDELLPRMIAKTEQTFADRKRQTSMPPPELVQQRSMIPQVFHFRVERLEPPDPVGN